MVIKAMTAMPRVLLAVELVIALVIVLSVDQQADQTLANGSRAMLRARLMAVVRCF